ncbi:hypothetical protein J4G33_13805 [Actinotalea sp. BY-33]|uniref:Uncharacterized protein n=1 Tax=Actinotalea soli TaxID=2819234 RepID=A0A939LS67_9CELL|nr:hypothetical protein [Actinotalea soli]MBO1752883.1 hypothetical protein [Actinotalea soli]
MISLDDVLSRTVDDALPLLTIDEFFLGNDEEESLAPNQWGYGRPALAAIAERLRSVEAHPDVDWVRVQLHDETAEGSDLVLAEAVAVCTSLDAEDLAGLVDTDWLESDGLVEGYVVEHRVGAPAVPEGSRVLSITWD